MPHRFRPDPALASVGPMLLQRLHERGALLDGAWFRTAQASLPREVIVHAFARTGADEGTVWLLRDAMLIPAINTGPNESQLIDTFRQPVTHGIIGMVAVTEQSFCENDIATNAMRDDTLDGKLGVQTQAMMAVPLVFAGGVQGVVSCVQFRDAEPATGFTPAHLESLEREVHVAGRLIDLALLDSVTGLQGG
jgi:transcriptional regulator with GAF, ATPase, and Fis domain